MLRDAPDLLDESDLSFFIELSVLRDTRTRLEADDALRRDALRLAQLADRQIDAGDAVTGMLLALESLERGRLVGSSAPLSGGLLEPL